MNSGTPSIMDIVVSTRGPLQEQDWVNVMIDVKSMVFREFDRITLKTFGQAIWLRGNSDDRSTNHKIIDDFKNRGDEYVRIRSLMNTQGMFCQYSKSGVISDDGPASYGFWGLTRDGLWVVGAVTATVCGCYHTARDIVNIEYLDDADVGKIIERIKSYEPEFDHLAIFTEISAFWDRVLSDREEVTRRLVRIDNWFTSNGDFLRARVKATA